IRHDPPRAFDAEDAVADSAFVLELIRLEVSGRLARSRREILLGGMAAAAAALELDPASRRALHADGFRWAIDIGRWDAVAQAGLEARFVALRPGLEELVLGASLGLPQSWGGDEAAALAMARWQRLAGRRIASRERERKVEALGRCPL